MKEEFKFTVFGRHFNHYDTYTLILNDEGWHVSHIAINGQCNRRGEPVLYQNFRQDSISYPADMASDMEDIWESFHEGERTHEEVQEALNRLGKWVDATGNARPALWD